MGIPNFDYRSFGDMKDISNKYTKYLEENRISLYKNNKKYSKSLDDIVRESYKRIDESQESFKALFSNGADELYNIPLLNFNGQCLKKLLRQIESPKDPKNFKEAILRAIQLYFDGLVENNDISTNPKIWAEQLKALDAILEGVRITTSGYYRQAKVPFSEVQKVVLPFSSLLIKYGSKEGCKSRHLSESEHRVRDYAANVANTLIGEDINLIIPVASGGFEPAALIADYLGINKMFPVRYSAFSRGDSDVLISKQAPQEYTEQQINGTKVLVVDDFVSSGKTADAVIKWLKDYNPARAYFSVTAVTMGSYTLDKFGLHRHKNSPYLYEHEGELVLS